MINKEKFCLKGPLNYADTRIHGIGWSYDCHASMVLQADMVDHHERYFKINVLIPDVKKSDIVNFLTSAIQAGRCNKQAKIFFCISD